MLDAGGQYKMFEERGGGRYEGGGGGGGRRLKRCCQELESAVIGYNRYRNRRLDSMRTSNPAYPVNLSPPSSSPRRWPR